MGVFDNMDQAEIFGDKKPYFFPGQHIVRIAGAKIVNGHKGETHIIEATILGVRSKDPGSSPVGTTCAQGFNASKNPSATKRATATWVKFLCAAYGVEKEAWDGPTWAANVANVIDNGALNGHIMGLDCHFKKMDNGEDFTVHLWKPTPSAEELARFGLDPAGAPIPGWVDPSPVLVQQVAAVPVAAQMAAAVAAAPPPPAVAPVAAAVAPVAQPQYGVCPHTGRPTMTMDGVNWTYTQ